MWRWWCRVRIVKSNLTTPAEFGGWIRFSVYKHVDQLASDVGGPGPFREIEAGRAD